MPYRKPLSIRIYNEDCFVGLKRIPDGTVNLIVTDPPYDIRYGDGGSINKVKKLRRSLDDLGNLRDSYDIEKFSEEVRRLQGANICVYFWCNKKQIPEYIRVYVEKLRCKFEIICWHKRNALPTYSNKYLSDTEYCLYFHKGIGKTHPSSFEDAKTYKVGLINHADKKKYGRPTVKPLEYIETFIRNSSNEGDLVLDPFVGSGTTAVACKNLGRRCVAFECDKKYFNIAVNRLNNEEEIRILE